MKIVSKLPTPMSKENRPGSSNARNGARSIINGLSDAEKKSLIINHTKPIKSAISAATAPRLQREATLPASSNCAPAKSSKVEKKTVTAARIPAYDYKARFNYLLE
ncbi:unnamed protein product [Leptidea sinapis]|uniref:Uncharacterized protein n=1 Tax=Leptidea sinapis TaxID=189913 RepID=A0A5E4QUK2_9NEOP|nr:unnamed protein product [Leptidea sinapis]